MLIEKLSHDLNTDDDFGSPVADDWDALPVLEPHKSQKLDGILCCGETRPQMRQRVFDIVIPSLTSLIGHATNWGEPPEDERRLGDYRFLVLSHPTGGGIDAYVQLWSEARGNVIIEVGPGNRPDLKL